MPHDRGMIESPVPARAWPRWPILLAALASCVAGILIQASAGRGIGDAPGLLLAIGCALAVLAGLTTRRPLLAGVASAAGFPFAAIVDMVRGGDHNLFPIEFALYGVYALGFAALAWAGSALLARRPASR